MPDDRQGGFKKDLKALSEKHFELFQISTRSGEAELNVEAFDKMIEEAGAISEKYNLLEDAQSAGYYSNLDAYAGNVSIYDSSAFLDDNSTPEFKRLMSEITNSGTTVDNLSIINSTSLLPNEQVALVMINNVVGSDGLLSSTRSACGDAYNASMKRCNRNLYIGIGLTVASFSVPFLSAAFGAATTYDYSHCSGAAMDGYVRCTGL